MPAAIAMHVHAERSEFVVCSNIACSQVTVVKTQQVVIYQPLTTFADHPVVTTTSVLAGTAYERNTCIVQQERHLPNVNENESRTIAGRDCHARVPAG